MNRVKAYVYILIFQRNYWAVARRQVRADKCFSHIAWLILISGMISGAPYVRATSVVAIRQGRTVYVGADSRVSGGSLPDSICKIGEIATGQFIAISAVLNVDEIHLSDAIRNSVRPAGIRETADAFVSVGTDYVKAVANRLIATPERYADTYDWYIQQRHPVVQAVFIGVEHSTSLFLIRTFTVHREGDQASVSAQSAECGLGCVGPRSEARVGEVTTSRQFAEDLFRKSETPIRGIQSLIGKEIAASPTTVFWPIDLLVVEPERTYWELGNDDGCEHIQPN